MNNYKVKIFIENRHKTEEIINQWLNENQNIFIHDFIVNAESIGTVDKLVVTILYEENICKFDDEIEKCKDVLE